MKRMKRIGLSIAVVLMLMLPGTALASGNTTDVEQKWVDLQKAVTDQMVKDGKITRQEADKIMGDLRTKFAESQGDSIYQMFSGRILERNKGSGQEGNRHDRVGNDEAAFRVYSLMTGKSVEDLKKTCGGSTTIWELAKKEGKLAGLKTRIYNTQAAGLDALVKGGIMTDQQRTKILVHVKGELDKK